MRCVAAVCVVCEVCVCVVCVLCVRCVLCVVCVVCEVCVCVFFFFWFFVFCFFFFVVVVVVVVVYVVPKQMDCMNLFKNSKNSPRHVQPKRVHMSELLKGDHSELGGLLYLNEAGIDFDAVVVKGVRGPEQLKTALLEQYSKNYISQVCAHVCVCVCVCVNVQHCKDAKKDCV